jgi:K(+)-stimulated pyrophosphate-energized sodium pump
MNPVIKFTTLFGLLAVELAITITDKTITAGLAAAFFLVSVIFVWRSFYRMRIPVEEAAAAIAVKAEAKS